MLVQRARVCLSRHGQAKYLSHLEQISSIRRALVNSGWPVLTSQGRRPKVKASFGPAISAGYESEMELCDVELEDRIQFNGCEKDLQKQLPEGFTVNHVKSIPLFFPSIEESANVAVYDVKSPLVKGTEKRWESFWESKKFVVEKKKADGVVHIDARPLVRKWELNQDVLKLELRFGPKRTLKPERIIQAVCQLADDHVVVGRSTSKIYVNRTGLFFERKDGRLMQL